MGFCGKLCTYLVLLLAVAIGIMLSGVLAQITPLMRFIDSLTVGGDPVLKGIVPAVHRGTPWGYTFEELQATDLSGRVIAITGGNIGLGYWTALNLAKQDAKVVIVCRSARKCEAAAKEIEGKIHKKVEFMTCDLASFKSILTFTKEFTAKYKRLDSLILNAGLWVAAFTKTKDDLETNIGVNHFGHFLLTQELLPLLKQTAKTSGVATIVSVSSNAHYSPYPEGILRSIEEMNDEKRFSNMEAYGQSKLANLLFAQELASRVKSDNILVNAVHPGAVRTQMQQLIADRMEETVGKTARDVIDRNIFSAICWSPNDASLTQIYTAVGNKIINGKVTGKYFHPIAREAAVSAHAKNSTLQKELWTLSEDFISSRRQELGV